MARLSRAEIFDPSEIVAVHTMARTNRRCFVMGDDPFTGKNFDHRKEIRPPQAMDRRQTQASCRQFLGKANRTETLSPQARVC